MQFAKIADMIWQSQEFSELIFADILELSLANS
jgi:hypothetical protein